MKSARIVPIILASALVASCSSQGQGSAAAGAKGEGDLALKEALERSLAELDGRLGEVTKVKDTLAEQAKLLTAARVDKRLPLGEVDGPAMRDVLSAYAKMHGLGDVQVKLGKADQAKPLPDAVEGLDIFPFETKHILGSVPVALSVRSTDEARLKAYFKAIVKLQLPLMVIPTLLLDEEKATFSGSLYFRHKVLSPRRAQPPQGLSELSKALGLAPPAGDARDDLVALHAQLMSKRARLGELLKDKDLVARQGRTLQFLRNKEKEIASQSVPKILRRASSKASPSAKGGNEAP